uniref:Uncharacterized protein n=1 Tax=Siphoviridae sp. ctbrg2 TaxID=2823589 RepID=A0A8S5LFY9_9CAUD|nr:MAG TPA: hypothetical protein [Siphoviridae sp. ctbrg2]DAZ47566.1 MAG TPA: hypothetical protein [Caudoviricetes sp.]
MLGLTLVRGWFPSLFYIGNLCLLFSIMSINCMTPLRLYYVEAMSHLYKQFHNE